MADTVYGFVGVGRMGSLMSGRLLDAGHTVWVYDSCFVDPEGDAVTLKAMQPEFKARNWPEIRIGVGLNTGRMRVGNMGSRIRLAYTVMGDAVNLASRLESQTKEYGVNLMISEFTLRKLEGKASEFYFRPLDKIQVKGKTEAVRIYEVIPSWSPWSKEDALREKFIQAYESHYLKRQFADARSAFHEILNAIPEDKATKHLLHLTEIFLENPPRRHHRGRF